MACIIILSESISRYHYFARKEWLVSIKSKRVKAGIVILLEKNGGYHYFVSEYRQVSLFC